MVLGYNKKTGWREYNSREEAKNHLSKEDKEMPVIIFEDGYTYLYLVREEINAVIVKYVNNETGDREEDEYLWKMGNSYLQTQVFPCLKRILRSNSKNNRYLRVRYKDGKILATDQLLSKQDDTNHWWTIQDNIDGITVNGNAYSYHHDGDVVATLKDIYAVMRLRKYYIKRGRPAWLHTSWDVSREDRKKLEDLFSTARRWDDDFDREVNALFVPVVGERDVQTVLSVPEDVDTGDEDSVQEEERVDDCDLILRTLKDLQLLDKTDFRQHLNFGNLEQELKRIYGEKQINRILGAGA